MKFARTCQLSIQKAAQPKVDDLPESERRFKPAAKLQSRADTLASVARARELGDEKAAVRALRGSLQDVHRALADHHLAEQDREIGLNEASSPPDQCAQLGFAHALKSYSTFHQAALQSLLQKDGKASDGTGYKYLVRCARIQTIF